MTKFNDGLLSGSRRPMLVVVKDNELYKFTGEHIPGVLAVTGEAFRKNGKWSNTDYTLRLAPGVRAYEVVKALHAGPWLSQFEGWEGVAAYFDVPRVEVEKFFRTLPGHNQGCEILDEREEALALLGEGS